jgi:hypothetical protein
MKRFDRNFDRAESFPNAMIERRRRFLMSDLFIGVPLQKWYCSVWPSGPFHFRAEPNTTKEGGKVKQKLSCKHPIVIIVRPKA